MLSNRIMETGCGPVAFKVTEVVVIKIKWLWHSGVIWCVWVRQQRWEVLSEGSGSKGLCPFGAKRSKWCPPWIFLNKMAVTLLYISSKTPTLEEMQVGCCRTGPVEQVHCASRPYSCWAITDKLRVCHFRQKLSKISLGARISFTFKLLFLLLLNVYTYIHIYRYTGKNTANRTDATPPSEPRENTSTWDNGCGPVRGYSRPVLGAGSRLGFWSFSFP